MQIGDMTSGDRALGDLLELSERIGRDPLLVQGAGGNVSIKRDDTLWIKASGTWLAEARTKPILVPVRLDAILRAFGAGDPACESCADFVDTHLNASALRPSIETTMHAVLPQKAVLHVHCVETLSFAARADAEALFAERLAGLPFAFIPYARPGVPLTREIVARLTPDIHILILGKHGLVVGAPTAAQAERLLREVSGRLRRPVRPVPPPDLERLNALAEATPFVPAPYLEIHGIGTDPDRLAAARQGSLYPDHVIFLGPGILEVHPQESVAQSLRRQDRSKAMLLAVPGAGALIRADATAGALALARCLADVTGRISPDEPLSPLTPQDEDALLNWDAEHYRRKLDRH